MDSGGVVVSFYDYIISLTERGRQEKVAENKKNELLGIRNMIVDKATNGETSLLVDINWPEITEVIVYLGTGFIVEETDALRKLKISWK